jgi:hypothetical protein
MLINPIATGNPKVNNTNETKPVYCTLNHLIFMNSSCYCEIPFVGIIHLVLLLGKLQTSLCLLSALRGQIIAPLLDVHQLLMLFAGTLTYLLQETCSLTVFSDVPLASYWNINCMLPVGMYLRSHHYAITIVKYEYISFHWLYSPIGPWPLILSVSWSFYRR